MNLGLSGTGGAQDMYGPQQPGDLGAHKPQPPYSVRPDSPESSPEEDSTRLTMNLGTAIGTQLEEEQRTLRN